MLTNNSESQDKKNQLDTDSSFITEDELSSIPSIDTSESKTDNFWQRINPFQSNKKIRTQLLTALLTPVIPALMLGGLASYRLVHETLEHEVEDKIANQVLLARYTTTDITEEILSNYIKDTGIENKQIIQVVDTQKEIVIKSFSADDSFGGNEIAGGETILNLSKYLVTQQGSLSQIGEDDLQNITNEINSQYGVKGLEVSTASSNLDNNNLLGLSVSFLEQGQRYFIATVPNTEFIAIASIDESELQSAGTELIGLFFVGTVALIALIVVVTLWSSNNLSSSMNKLTQTAEDIIKGDLDALAPVEGSLETATLGRNFNNLTSQIKSLLDEQQNSLQEFEVARQEAETLATEKQQQTEAIQNDLLTLLYDVEGASSGDLTVRAQISDGEIGIVADFFNSIVENLRDIVTQVKDTTLNVNQSLVGDEEKISILAQEATNQSAQIQTMLNLVEQMGDSIKQVSNNTQSAAQIAQQASQTAQTGGVTIDKTVDSIIQLRDTVGETAKKVKRLGESSQQISKVISLINQIALQTNLLAINASIEAARAGEEGRGFAVVAEEVGQLAAQSASATKEIEQIVEAIQKETSSVVEAMEDGTAQVVESTQLVAEAKKGFGEITQVSQQIDNLLQSISVATVSQTKNSQVVSDLVQKIARISQTSSDFSSEVAQSLEETVTQARQLQSSVETFKVN